jgi:hypothetical protein
MVYRILCSALGLTFVGLAGCHNPLASGYSCPAVVSPTIVVAIRDARTGAPLANDARGAVYEGAYVDSLTPYESTGTGAGPFVLVSRRAADERPGNYSVEVSHPGYRAWTLEGVRATAGQCGVKTPRISALLELSA